MRRGVTLVELLVGLAVTSIVLAAVGTAIVAGQTTYRQEAHVKQAVEGGRISNAYIDNLVRMAGYGLDPGHAFDFAAANLPGATKDNFVGANFITDDLALRFRDPTWVRRGRLDVGGTTLTLDGGQTFGVPLKQNQAVILGCEGANEFFIGAINSPVTATATSVGVQPYNAVFPQATAFPAAVPACLLDTYAGSAAFVMLIREARIRVVDLNGRPYLVVFHNMAAPDPAVNLDFDPIASDVENFQVAYQMNRLPANTTLNPVPPVVDAAGNSNWILGDLAGEGIPDPALAPPGFQTPYEAAERFNAHPANIRSVRTSMIVRSLRSIERQGTPPIALENDPVPPAANDGFYRTILRSNIRVGNMLSRSFHVPALNDGTASTDGFNHNGG